MLTKGHSAKFDSPPPFPDIIFDAGRKSIIRDGSKTKCLPHSMYYALHVYISAKTYAYGFINIFKIITK